MSPVPSKISDRLAKGIKFFQPILSTSKARDDGEGDTVRIVTDMLAEIFGYDKYSEITTEYAIRGTYCDLATKVNGALQTLFEVKAIGLELKDAHIKQAVDYAANQGVDWVVLTNGIFWKVFKVTFSKPIDSELVVEFNFGELNPKSDSDIDKLYLLCKEAWAKSVLGEYHLQKQTLNRFFLAAVVMSEPVLEVIRRETRKVTPEVKISVEEIQQVMAYEVLKRDVMEGDKAEEAKRKISRAASRRQRAKQSDEKPDSEETEQDVAAAPQVPADTTPPTQG